jgi:deoxyribonucleoside regulator
MDDSNKLELIIMAARMYYEDNLTQFEIAKKLKISRPTVSRLLSEARRRKLVEVTVNYPWRSDSQLEADLIKKFNLRDARVLVADELSASDMLKGVGIMGAQLVEKYLDSGMTFAISRGTGVYSTVEALQPRPELKVTVVQLQGALGDYLGDGSDIAIFLKSRYTGSFYFLHAPLLLENPLATDILLKEPSICAVLERAKHADMALVGIGSIDSQVNSLLRYKLLSISDVKKLEDQGVVGDIAGRFYGQDGEEIINNELNHRLVCLKLEDLRKIPIVLGVASGLVKIRSIQTSLYAHNINMLATDSGVAYHLLRD